MIPFRHRSVHLHYLLPTAPIRRYPPPPPSCHPSSLSSTFTMEFVCYSAALFHEDDMHVKLMANLDNIQSGLASIAVNDPSMEESVDEIIASTQEPMHVLHYCILVDDAFSAAGAMYTIMQTRTLDRLTSLLQVDDMSMESRQVLNDVIRMYMEVVDRVNEVYYKLGAEVHKIETTIMRLDDKEKYYGLRAATIGHIIVLLGRQDFDVMELLEVHSPFNFDQATYLTEMYHDVYGTLDVGETTNPVSFFLTEEYNQIPMRALEYRDWCLGAAGEEFADPEEAPLRWTNAIGIYSEFPAEAVARYGHLMNWSHRGVVVNASPQTIIRNWSRVKQDVSPLLEYCMTSTPSLTKFILENSDMCPRDAATLYARFAQSEETIKMAIELIDDGYSNVLISVADNQTLTPYLAHLCERYAGYQTEAYMQLLKLYEVKQLIFQIDSLTVNAASMISQYVY